MSTSKNIWVISDTHFGDAGFLSFTDYKGNRVRKFESVEDMNEHMVDKWNSVVADKDIVYHLGDVFYDRHPSDRTWFEVLWSRLKGHKRLVVGNHDDVRYLSGKNEKGNWLFEKVMYWRRFPDRRILMTHAPIHVSGLYGSPPYTNVHGHIHTNPCPDGPYQCVCVEPLDYTPIHIDHLGSTQPPKEIL